MELEIPLLLSTLIFSGIRAKISHVILSIQVLVTLVVCLCFLHSNNRYLSYAIIYVYVGAICVLFLYFMMLLHGTWELLGTNSYWPFYFSFGIELFTLLYGYMLASQETFNGLVQFIQYDLMENLQQVAQNFLVQIYILITLVLLLFLGVCAPIFITSSLNIFDLSTLVKTRLRNHITSSISKIQVKK